MHVVLFCASATVENPAYFHHNHVLPTPTLPSVPALTSEMKDSRGVHLYKRNAPVPVFYQTSLKTPHPEHFQSASAPRSPCPTSDSSSTPHTPIIYMQRPVAHTVPEPTPTPKSRPHPAQTSDVLP